MHGFQRIKRAIGDNWNGGNGQLLFHLFLNEQEELEELLILDHASWIRQQSTIIKI